MRIDNKEIRKCRKCGCDPAMRSEDVREDAEGNLVKNVVLECPKCGVNVRAFDRTIVGEKIRHAPDGYIAAAHDWNALNERSDNDTQ